jgi:hypothetical protein
MVTPLVARAAIPIILWKDGCSRACIGLIDEARLETHRPLQDKVTYLVSRNQPFYSCLTEYFVQVRNYSFWGYLSQMALKRVLSHSASILSSLLGRFSSIWEFTGEIVTLAPLIVGTLFKRSIKYLTLTTSATDHVG